EEVEVGAELAIIGSGEGGGESAPAQEEQPAEEPAPEQPAEQEQPAEEPAPEQPAEQEQPAASDSGDSAAGQPVQMPALGESVTEGTITRWLKNEGDQVEVDEPLLEVSTDKVDTEVPSPLAGVLSKILVQEDETVDVGADLAIIGGDSGGGAPSESTPAASAAEQTPQDAGEQATEAEQPSE